MLARRMGLVGSTRRKDRFTREKRSEIMSKIRSKFTKLDLTMRSLLIENQVEFVMYPDLYGRPDFLLPPNIALFCDSSFWHGKNWPTLKARLLRGSRASYWVDHIGKNRKRDSTVNRTLRQHGFVVLRFWDVDIWSRSGNCIRKIETLASSKAGPHSLMECCAI